MQQHQKSRSCIKTHTRPYDCIMVVIDKFSKRAHFIPTTSETTAHGTAQFPSKYPPGFHTVDTLGNSWKPVYIPRGNYGNCCIGNPWKPMETYGNLWTLSWKPMATVASETCGNPWTSIPWVSMDFHILWKHMET